MKRWIIKTSHYSGLRKQAVNMVNAAISDLVSGVVPVVLPGDEARFSQDDYQCIWLALNGEERPPVAMNVPGGAQGYAVYVGSDPCCGEKQVIVICGYDEAGLLYGCADFCNSYCGAQLLGLQDIWQKDFFVEPMGRLLPSWEVACVPAVKERGIWTWGHMIYDYRGFFENMARLRLNQIVIWNDHPPVNAEDVVCCAHAHGIRVIWGFTWGWSQPQYMVEYLKSFDGAAMEALAEQIINTWRKDYANIPGDGIYFQSFTELPMEEVGGKCIAQLVVELVNTVGKRLLREMPAMELQFGLHAMSVKNKLAVISQVDPRIRIVWEDCGSFPYDYRSDIVEGFEETLGFTEKLLALRGGERFGAVLKGMTKLDWYHFSHFVGRYIMGSRSDPYISQRCRDKNLVWKQIQAGWMCNGHYAAKLISAIANGNEHAVVQALVEDGMLERDVMLPVALYAQMLWEPNRSFDELLQETALWPCVKFGQL